MPDSVAKTSSGKQPRVILPLLKAYIVERDAFGFKMHLGGTTNIRVDCNNMAAFDIRDGDLLQLYTEVLLAPAKGTS